MSGALVTHRPGSKPLIIDGTPVLKFDKYGKAVMRHVLRPGGVYKNGRCVEWQVLSYVATRHVLNHVEAPDRPSKHARGRTRPRTRAERTRMANLRARAVQARKSMTIDINRYAAIYDEL
jgi:hypothetical protein